jgi:glycosyltransferase involved in cell wall biosynthesis
MNVLIWHVHGSWMTAFVQGRHRYLIPVVPDRSPEGLGRARTWDWPESAVEITRAEAADADVDVVVVQRPAELFDLAPAWLGGRRPGIDLPAVYVEHNAPEGAINDMRHPVADHSELVLCHVTAFNALFWDSGSTRTVVIEHGIVDPGLRYSGEEPRMAAVINEPSRRGRVVGADLLARLAAESGVALDLFGMASAEFGGVDLPQGELHRELPRRRVYLHPYRWTSLGLSLVEAMHLGMPVVTLATTEVPEAVPSGAGIVSNRIESLTEGIRRLNGDPELSRAMGKRGREYALERYGLDRFLADWDALLEGVA